MKMRALLVLTLVVVVGFAQEQAPNVNRDRARNVRGMNYGNWVGRHLLDKEVIEKVGLSEEQVAKLREEMGKIDVSGKELEEKIRDLSLRQAEIAKKVLAEPEAKLDPVMEIIEQIGQLRIEQAKNSTKALAIMRDTLTEAQRTKANEVIMNEGRRRFAERGGGRRGGANQGEGAARGPRAREGQRGGDGPAQQRPPVPGGW